MSQAYELFVPTVKHIRLIQSAMTEAIEQEKYNDKAKLLKANDEVLAYFAKYRYWWVSNSEMILDTKHGNLWQAASDGNYYDVENAKEYASQLKLAGLTWQLPTPNQLKEIVGDKSFPLITWERNILDLIDIMTNQNTMWLDHSYPNLGDSLTEVLCIHHNSIFLDPTATLNFILQKKWKIRPYGVYPKDSDIQQFVLNHTDLTWNNFQDDNAYLKRNPYSLGKNYNNLAQFLINYQDDALANFYENLNILTTLQNKKYEPNPNRLKVSETWQDIDYLTTRLPKIDKLRFDDVEQGMWEFYAPTALQDKMTKITSNEFVRPRNPADDIREATVAIDFGTSSTVVAIRENGRDELLRIGLQAKDFKEKNEITDDQYENPTVLEFLNIRKFLEEWHSEAYRPLVDWRHIHCSHEARAKLRNNGSNTKVVSSILLRLKQWALRNEKNAQVRIKDQQGFEYQLKSLEEKNPVKGQPLQLSDDYPELDPIEIYAWFLGMNINWRNRGIFLNYVLTFPINYSNEVKAKILASFRRGIQRSLPESLVYDECFNDFRVEELQSEPAAFAAAALKRLDIKADEQGVAYGVFDFGGGTTDFDYGIYREPTPDEYDDGWDEVLEHFGSSGDNFLGGENLLENMAYKVFEYNSPECRKQGINFTLPIDAAPFAGSETLIAQTQAAYTNTTVMMSKLRPLWENGKIDSNATGVEKFKLINKDGEAVDCEISIKQDMLIGYLKDRILQGLIGFFTTLKVAFEQRLNTLPDVIHILLAGNSSRSNIVLGYLGCLDDKEAQELNDFFTEQLQLIFDEILKLEVHKPLDTDINNPYAPTAKTGVALGLLKVAGGEGLKVINHVSKANTDSPFQFFIGGFRRDILNVSIHRGHKYDEWVELGKPRNGIFIMGYTQLPTSSVEGSTMRGTSGVFEKNLKLSGDMTHQRVFAKVIAPNKVEVCTAENLEDISKGNSSNQKQVELS